MRTTQKQLDALTRQVSLLLSEKSQLETRTRILEQVVHLNTNHEQRLHANQAGCLSVGGLCLLFLCSCAVVAGQQRDDCIVEPLGCTQHAERAARQMCQCCPSLSLLYSSGTCASHGAFTCVFQLLVQGHEQSRRKSWQESRSFCWRSSLSLWGCWMAGLT